MSFDNPPENIYVRAAGILDVLEVTLALDTSQYADGDVLSDTAEIQDAFNAVGGMMEVTGLTVIDQDDQGAALDVIFLRSNKSLGTKNSAPNISDADGLEIIGRVSVGAGDYYDFGAFRRAEVSVPCLLLKAASDSRSLFVSAISRGTGTYTASGVRLRIKAAR